MQCNQCKAPDAKPYAIQGESWGDGFVYFVQVLCIKCADEEPVKRELTQEEWQRLNTQL